MKVPSIEDARRRLSQGRRNRLSRMQRARRRNRLSRMKSPSIEDAQPAARGFQKPENTRFCLKHEQFRPLSPPRRPNRLSRMQRARRRNRLSRMKLPSIEDARRRRGELPQPSIEDETTVYRGCAKGLSTANRLSRMKLPSIEDAADRLSRMRRTVYRGCECPAEQATTGVRPGLTRARGLTRLSLNGLTWRKATDAASWGLRPRRLGPSAPQPTRRPPGLRPRPSASPCYRAPTPRRGGITPLRGLCAPSSRGLPPPRPPCGRLCRPPVANSPPRGPSSPPA